MNESRFDFYIETDEMVEHRETSRASSERIELMLSGEQTCLQMLFSDMGWIGWDVNPRANCWEGV
jgi:hypothetical protein